eukprot:jgi/Galph1/4810/GphlegSOOS_G3501.1
MGPVQVLFLVVLPFLCFKLFFLVVLPTCFFVAPCFPDISSAIRSHFQNLSSSWMSRSTPSSFSDEKEALAFSEEDEVNVVDKESLYLVGPQIFVSSKEGRNLKTKKVLMSDRGIQVDMKSEQDTVALPSETVDNIAVAKDSSCSEEEHSLVDQVISGTIPIHSIEKNVPDFETAVRIRRKAFERRLRKKSVEDAEEDGSFEGLPYENYDYKKVYGSCCELVIGYVPIPVGFAGPLMVNNERIYFPMATTEGCLVASTNRGCKAITESFGCQSYVVSDGMTRAPCIRFPSIQPAIECKNWLEREETFQLLSNQFNSTSRYGRLQSIKVAIAGRNLYLRFKCSSGDAMGMNMVSKGTEKALDIIKTHFPDMEVVSLSGNYCSDKKPAAVNWIEGRGKTVVAEAVIRSEVVQRILKTNVSSMVDCNIQKNLVGSVMAGSLGGFNAHAANIVASLFIATGQDAAQVVESSHCITLMESTSDGDLRVSVTLPCLEVGTIGGGTVLPAQASCLRSMGIDPNLPSIPGENSRKLAAYIGAAVLAGELSLMAALTAGHLVKAHMQYNRSVSNLNLIDSQRPRSYSSSLPPKCSSSSSSRE